MKPLLPRSSENCTVRRRLMQSTVMSTDMAAHVCCFTNQERLLCCWFSCTVRVANSGAEESQWYYGQLWPGLSSADASLQRRPSLTLCSMARAVLLPTITHTPTATAILLEHDVHRCGRVCCCCCWCRCFSGNCTDRRHDLLAFFLPLQLMLLTNDYGEYCIKRKSKNKSKH